MAERLSDHLQALLNANQPKTLDQVINIFADKSFAILFLLLMAIPALPLPTGGITHIFELIVMLLAIELIAGRRSVWLPQRWRNRTLSKKFRQATLPSLTGLIKRVEKFSRPRLSRLMLNPWFLRLIGLLVLIFTLFAFLAPPFSGLDTLPALGVVLISLALILKDMLLAVAGLVVGLIGIGLVLVLGRLVLQLF